MSLDKETKAGLNRSEAELNELDKMRHRLHRAIAGVSNDANVVVPALMVLLSDYVGHSNNSTNDIVEQFRMCVEEARGEGRFSKMGRI